VRARRRGTAGWAERPGEERGRVLLGAAELLEQSHDELAEWIVRETGGVEAKAEIELADAGQRLRNSAAIAGEESERELATAQPDRRSVARRVPLGGRGGDHSLQLPAHPLDSRGGAGAGDGKTPSC
jgi:benzaldehyde dehydrogenase (NAD)